MFADRQEEVDRILIESQDEIARLVEQELLEQQADICDGLKVYFDLAVADTKIDLIDDSAQPNSKL